MTVRHHLIVLLVIGLWPVACGKSPSAPTPSPVPATPAPAAPQPAPNTVITGRLTDTVTGSPIDGATIDLAGIQTSTASGGTFRYELPPGTVNPQAMVKISSPASLERTLYLLILGPRNVELNSVSLTSGFDLAYYRRFVRDDFDSPGVLRTLRRWTQAPKIYVRTVDELGAPIEAATLNPVVAALQDDASAWTGGRFGLASVELGTETREGQNGWITVKWSAPLTDPDSCARAQVAVNGGWIALNYLQRTGCDCRGSRIGTKTVRHELGHAMGFYHTGDRNDVMWGTAICEDRRASPRERLHAAIAYGRPFGNADPDIDPGTSVQSFAPPIVIID